MNYSFKRSSEVYIAKDGIGYHLCALSNFTLAQTITEKTVNRRNLFSRVAPKQVINKSANAGTGSLEFYFTRNSPAIQLLFESFDFVSDYNYTFRFDNIYSAEPKSIGIVVYDNYSDKSINIEKAYITNIDVQCSPTNMNKITVGFVYSESDELDPHVHLESTVQPDYPPNEYLDFRLLNKQIHTVTSGAFTITRDVRWTDTGNNQFSLGKLGVVSAPIVTGFDISAHVAANDNLEEHTFKHLGIYSTDVILGNNSFFISIPNAAVTVRKEPSEVFSISFDIKHKSLSPVHIGGTYYGYIN